jgi:hypothetical protein
MVLNISLRSASEARLREMAQKAGTDVTAYVSRLIELDTEQGRVLPNNLAPPGMRPIGLAKGTFEIPSSFFDSLPDDVLEAFEGVAR